MRRLITILAVALLVTAGLAVTLLVTAEPQTPPPIVLSPTIPGDVNVTATTSA